MKIKHRRVCKQAGRGGDRCKREIVKHERNIYIKDIERVDKAEEEESSSRGKSINIWKSLQNFTKSTSTIIF